MNWKKVKLGDICIYQKKSTIKAGEGLLHGDYPFFTSSAIQNKFTNDFLFEGPGLVFGTGGNANIHYCDKKFAVSTDCLVLKAKENNIYLKFIYYYLAGNISILENGFKGAGLKHISKDYIARIEIPLPDLATQKHIAEILDKADALRQQNRALLAQYDELLQSTFIELFGDPVKNPKGWEVRKLGEVCEKITDGTHQSPKFIESGVPFLFVSNIVNNQINYDASRFISEKDFELLNKRTPIEIGNILYTIVGSYGNPAIIKELRKFAFQRHIAFLKPNHTRIDYSFLHGQLQTDYIKNQVEKRVKGVAQKTLNLSELKEINTILPPLSLQHHFAKIVEQIEVQKEQAKTALAESEALFEGLLAKYFG